MNKVEINIEGELLDRLSAAFYWQEDSERAPDRPSRGNLTPMRFIVARVNGLSIKILADEHPPPHFHVTYQGRDASFSIEDGRRLPNVGGLERFERTITKWWAENRALLITEWNTSRPSDCPVGPIVVSPK
jgi:hypothetical protein